jgi:hypothetical protein
VVVLTVGQVGGHIGVHWGGKFYIWEGIIYHIPIWDIFAHEREQGRAGESSPVNLGIGICGINGGGHVRRQNPSHT